MEILSAIGAGGLAGLVIGVAVTAWVQPATTEGQLLLVLLCGGVGLILSGALRILRLMLGRRGDGEE